MTSRTPGQVLGPMFEAISADAGLALDHLGLPHSAAIVDVGTGKGNFAIALALRGFQVLTGEPDEDTSRYARQDWAAKAEKLGVKERIRFQAFDASQLPFEAATFDAVFFFGVLHHIPEALRSDVVSEALRVIRKQGSVVFFEPRRETLEKLWVEDPTHPLAADPSQYLGDHQVRELKILGGMMEIFIYSPA